MSPARRRDAVAHLTTKFKVSQRLACRVLDVHRSSARYVAVPVDFETKLVARMRNLAELHPRWGYRMVHGLLVEEGWPVRSHDTKYRPSAYVSQLSDRSALEPSESYCKVVCIG